MPERVPSMGAAAAATAAGAVNGIGPAAAWSQPDIVLLSGVFCGALVFLLRSREPSRLKKAVYFGVSLVGGYALTPHLGEAVPSLPLWLAAFVSSALLVAIAMVVLDWAEASVPQILSRLVERVLGGGGESGSEKK
ncbi:putative holin [Variovorax sp. J22P168]|uniref:putative holin n=1 Tax=Variovorax jilinensis TaxID=3053513 RepID=UPI00257744C3|nr:putative holin [Variovorax sp. J22P168]MDM0011993.1 putative holin [Variovorax sp. J22P168]